MKPLRKIALLGSTGSVGQNTLDVVRLHPELFVIKALAAKSNIALLEKQIAEFHPEIVCVFEEKEALELQKKLSSLGSSQRNSSSSDSAGSLFPKKANAKGPRIVFGIEGLKEVSSLDSIDFVMAATSGSSSLLAVLAAIDAKKSVGFVNKEILIMAGEMIMKKVKENRVEFLPIDSEHSAIFQCLEGKNIEEVKKIIITASGGPFFFVPKEEWKNLTIKEALKHPTYKMGAKITIDSSTLMNKGLELIEAHFLFGFPLEKMQVVVHPQSIIHSFVEWVDGSFFAQMSNPDMKFPIQYALGYPKKIFSNFSSFDFSKSHKLELFPCALEKFPCLFLAAEALKKKKSFPCFLNAANEVLVQRFLEGKISWISIGEKLEKLISLHQPCDLVTLDEVFAVDKQAREEAAYV
jgi:1-deoxy-D-xylulose-5-phosphate reductoisomerase